jgi:hypothetical protein
MGRGGSRWGAGRPAYRAKAEHLQRVEISIWQRRNLLQAGNFFSWSWNRGGERTGSIAVKVHGEYSLALQYCITGDDGQRRDASQTIAIDHTPCHYGKTRPWFQCPRCHSRAGLLFLRWGRFACRKCQRVSYTSQSCDTLDRTWRKQSKLEARLGDDWERPKGMRHHTYDRLIDALEDCEERRDLAFYDKAARLFGLVGLRELENRGL